jgi:hypothetical protein
MPIEPFERAINPQEYVRVVATKHISEASFWRYEWILISFATVVFLLIGVASLNIWLGFGLKITVHAFSYVIPLVIIIFAGLHLSATETSTLRGLESAFGDVVASAKRPPGANIPLPG